MEQEARIRVPIGVLHGKLQGIQQQIYEHDNWLRVLDSRMDRIELSIAAMQALVEERLPPRQQTTMVQLEP